MSDSDLLASYRSLIESQQEEINRHLETIQAHEKTIVSITEVLNAVNKQLLEDTKIFDLCGITMKMQREYLEMQEKELQRYRAAFGGQVKDTSNNMPN